MVAASLIGCNRAPISESATAERLLQLARDAVRELLRRGEDLQSLRRPVEADDAALGLGMARPAFDVPDSAAHLDLLLGGQSPEDPHLPEVLGLLDLRTGRAQGPCDADR